jgi:hypothetical protein
MKLLRGQTNQIFDLITKHKLVPSKFLLYKAETDFLNIKYGGGEYYFDISFIDPKYRMKYSPGELTLITEFEFSNMEWAAKLKYIDSWLQNLKEETEEPDKWEGYYYFPKSFKDSGINWEEQDFTTEEKNVVNEKLYLLKEGISKLDLLEDQIENLNKSIDNLSKKVDNLNKIDWKNMLVGTLFNKFFDLSISSEVAKQIWNMVTQLFSNIPLLK